MTGSADKIRALAFRSPDGAIVLELLNRRTTAAPVAVGWRGQVLKADLPALSISTYQWSAN